jgi:DnaJ-like protein
VYVLGAEPTRRTLIAQALTADRYTVVFAAQREELLAALAGQRVCAVAVPTREDALAVRAAAPTVPIVPLEATLDLATFDASVAAASGWTPAPQTTALPDAAIPELDSEELRSEPIDTRIEVDVGLTAPPQSVRTGTGPHAKAPTQAWANFRARVDDLHARMEHLSYYDLLGLQPGATAPDVKRAYFACAEEFHPDRFLAHRDGELRDKVYELFKRMCEGFKLLSDPERRHAYDAGLSEGQVRVTTTERHKGGPRSLADVAHTTAGRKYAQAADDAERKHNWSSAKMYWSLAAQTEPDNAELAAKLAEATSRLAVKR